MTIKQQVSEQKKNAIGVAFKISRILGGEGITKSENGSNGEKCENSCFLERL